LPKTDASGFVAFDTYKAMLADKDGKVSGPANVIAGFGAGVTESLFAVTPFESIKTQLYAIPRIATPLTLQESTTANWQNPA
jgi:solute carrier family 25 citrate transporter 1